ncbi:MAG: SDR family NAD(P)-dependent oxidoreductase, partial [Acidimicrobiia bacterium]
MKVAVVGGTAGFGYGLVLRLAKLGEEVVIGSRQRDKAQSTAQRVKEVVGADARVTGAENS